ncbi:MAG: hypothetical protein AAB527_02210 [Patescibacteria group bacterium]
MLTRPASLVANAMSLIADLLLDVAWVICFAIACLFLAVLNFYDKLADGFEKRADRVGLILGTSIMSAGAIAFIVGIINYS